MLRAFAARLIERHPEYAVRLVVSEPGYMHVEIDVGGARRVAELLVAADSPDGVRWGYAYDLSSPRASGGLELQFGADGIDDAIEELHRFAAGPAHYEA